VHPLSGLDERETVPSSAESVAEATRYLCAAVHLDRHLADALVEEYLSEPKRAVPPSPGVHAGAVLREAVSARARARKFEAILLSIFVALALFAPALVVAWLCSALSWKFWGFAVDCASMVRSGRRAPNRLSPRQRRWATSLLWSGTAIIWVWAALAGLNSLLGESDGGSAASFFGAFAFTSVLVLVPAAYAVLVALSYLPWHTAETWFQFGAYHPDAGAREAAQRACRRYEDRLRRIAVEEARRAHFGAGEVVVYRGRDPFVGAGARVRSWSSAFQLRSKDTGSKDDRSVPAFAPAELYRYVSEEVAKLREAQYLSPGLRFGGMRSTQWAAVSAAQLPYVDAGRMLLAQLEDFRDPELAEQDWVELANSSPEWLRYYHCYRVDGWAQQLVVSGYLHIGCEERTLYLEWHGFVLAPVTQGVRSIDNPPRHIELRSVWRALVELALLPVSLPGRIADAIRGIKESTGLRNSHWATPAQAAEVFGSSAGLREIAAGKQLNNTFQELDSSRYLKILERRVLDAVQRFLDEREIHAQGFNEMVAQINNSMVFNNSNIMAGNIGGEFNTGSVGAGSASGESSGE
jgi:hypothetical protein